MVCGMQRRRISLASNGIFLLAARATKVSTIVLLFDMLSVMNAMICNVTVSVTYMVYLYNLPSFPG